MAVNESLTAYSTTAASNTPAGTDTVGPDLDNHLRDIKKNIRAGIEHQVSDATPEGAKGFINVTATASPTYRVRLHDGAGWVDMIQVDASANTSVPFIGANAMTSVMQSLNQDSTASARTTLGLTPGTSTGNIVQTITGSATSIAALPVLSGENLVATREEIMVAASDEGTEIVSATSSVVKFRMPFAMKLSDVKVSANSGPSATATFDINEAGSTILSTKLHLDPGEKSSRSAATSAVISDSVLADDAEISFDIDNPGTAGLKGVKFTLIGTRN